MNIRLIISLFVIMLLHGCSASLINSARTYERKGDYSMSVRYYDKAIAPASLSVKNVQIYMQLARIYASAGQFNAADQWLKKAMQIMTGLSETEMRLVLSESEIEYFRALKSLKNGNYKRCTNIFENMLKNTTKDTPDIHYYLAIAYNRQSKKYSLPGSIMDTENVETLSPEFSETIKMINQGREIVKSNPSAIEEARAKFELAINAVPENITARDNYERSLIFLKKKDYAGAVSILSDMSETPDVVYYMSDAYQKLADIHTQKAGQ